MILTVPRDEKYYPTLGPQVCAFIEQNLVFGPGDLRGKPAVMDLEKQALVYRFYEVYPKGHARAGRRRFKRCGASLAKGLAKTELAAWIAACELHPEAPVRCTGFTKDGEPIGGPVTDPYIPLVAYTEEQSDELCYGALRMILEEGPLRSDFDIGLDRILRLKGGGKAVSLSNSPNALDGARTTFSVADETHRFTLPRLKDAHKVMMTNLPKRRLADAWMLEITTAPEPGAGSVAEGAMDYALSIQEGKVTDAAFFYFHRQAGDEHDLTTEAGFRAAVEEASGAAASWRDIDSIVALWNDPTQDRTYLERVYCNRLVKSGTQAFDVVKWRTLERSDVVVSDGSLITLGFDGGLFHDSTGLIATEVKTGYQWTVGLWERPPRLPKEAEWQVPAEEVDALVVEMFGRFKVWRFYADPFFWQGWVAKWRGQFGEERVIEWLTNRRRQMATALENFDSAIKEGHITHEGDPDIARHLGNARREDLPGWKDEQGRALWLIKKDRPDSLNKIDGAMASVLSWEARTDAIAAGAADQAEPQFQMMVFGGR